MVTSVTCEGPLPFPDALVRAVARHAERQADLTDTYLRVSGLCRAEGIRLPAAALLELAAVLELGAWEKCGVRRHLDVDLPTYREAADTLADRCTKGPAKFKGPKAAPLAQEVLRVWIEHFAWDGPDTLKAEIILGEVDEDQFADILAEFVWQHRHALGSLLMDKPTASQREEP